MYSNTGESNEVRCEDFFIKIQLMHSL